MGVRCCSTSGHDLQHAACPTCAQLLAAPGKTRMRAWQRCSLAGGKVQHNGRGVSGVAFLAPSLWAASISPSIAIGAAASLTQHGHQLAYTLALLPVSTLMGVMYCSSKAHASNIGPTHLVPA